MKQNTTVLALFMAALNGCASEAFNEPIPAVPVAPTVAAAPKAEDPSAEAESAAARLWFHVHNEQQQQFIESLGNRLKLDKNIIIEPVQLVEAGPRKTQLRFFTLQDKSKAKELLQKFKKIFPNLQLLDLSHEYGTSIMPGHFELWLAPDMKKINLPQPEVTPSTLPASTLPPLSKP